MKTIKAIGLAFLTAAFLWGFIMTQQIISKLVFEDGVRQGYGYCKKETAGGFLSTDATMAIDLEYRIPEALRE